MFRIFAVSLVVISALASSGVASAADTRILAEQVTDSGGPKIAYDNLNVNGTKRTADVKLWGPEEPMLIEGKEKKFYSATYNVDCRKETATHTNRQSADDAQGANKTGSRSRFAHYDKAIIPKLCEAAPPQG